MNRLHAHTSGRGRRGALARHFAQGGDVEQPEAPSLTTGATGAPQFTPGGNVVTGALGNYLNDSEGGGSNIGGPTGGALAGGPPGTPNGGQLGTMSNKMATNLALSLIGLVPGLQIPAMVAKLGLSAYGYMNPDPPGSIGDSSSVNSIGAGGSLGMAGAGNLAGTQAGALNGMGSITGDPKDADPNGGPEPANAMDMSGSNIGGAMLGNRGGHMHNGRIGALSRRRARK